MVSSAVRVDSKEASCHVGDMTCPRHPQADQAMAVFEDMRRGGVQPWLATLNSLLRTLAAAARWDDSQEVSGVRKKGTFNNNNPHKSSHKRNGAY